MCCASERCERRVSGVSGETESEGRKPRQLTELPHATDRSRDEVSRAVELFAEQHMSDGITESDKVLQQLDVIARADDAAGEDAGVDTAPARMNLMRDANEVAVKKGIANLLAGRGEVGDPQLHGTDE